MDHRFRRSYPRESADVGRPSRRRPGVNSASLKVIYLWFMEERARYAEAESFSASRRRGGKNYRSGTMDRRWYRLHVESHGRPFCKKTKRMSAVFLAFGRRKNIAASASSANFQGRATLETETPSLRRLQLRMQLNFFFKFFYGGKSL